MGPFLLNPARMTFHIPGVLGGLLLSGRKGEGCEYGNGDCILLDGALGLAGIADGSERSPEASREFLMGISARLSGKPGSQSEDPFNGFLDAAQSVLDSFRYEDRTTFVCVLFPGGDTVYYLCGGDSLLFHLDPGEARIRFRNRANMGFAGRSTRVVDSGRIRVKPGDLILMATDGIWDLTGGDSEELTRAFFASVRSGPFHQATERLAWERHAAFGRDMHRSYDDFGAVLMDPYRMARFPWRLVAGGTSDVSEARHRLLRERVSYTDRHVPLTERDTDFWVFPEDLHLVEGHA